MPLKLIRHLDAREREIYSYRQLLKESPMMLDRAETSFRAYAKIRDKMFEESPKLLELRGIVAGMNQAAPILQAHQEMVKGHIKDDKVDPVAGKYTVTVIGQMAVGLKGDIIARKDEYQSVVGRLDGLYWAAVNALDEIQNTINQYVRSQSREEEEESDPLGWGTENGTRPVNGGNGASVTPIKAAKSKGTTKKKRVVRRVKKGSETSEVN